MNAPAMKAPTAIIQSRASILLMKFISSSFGRHGQCIIHITHKEARFKARR